jgi:hypothetical protein
MAWFKVDDGWHKHRKRVRTGMDLEGFAARGLWLDAGSWASDEGTDGWVPVDMLDYIAPGMGRKLADRLVRSGLWYPMEERDGEEGFQYHDWQNYNPLRDDAEVRAAKLSEDGKRGNHTRWHVERGVSDPACSYCSGKVSTRPKARTTRAPARAVNGSSPTRSGTRVAPDVATRSGTRIGSASPDPARPVPTPKGQNQEPSGVDLVALPHGKFPDTMSEEDKPALMRSPLTTVRCPEHQDRKIGDCHWCKSEHGNRQWYADPAHWTRWETLADFQGDIARVKAWAART